MQAHCERLSKLCRICGNKIKIKNRYPKEASIYCAELNRLFKINIADDDYSIHPKFVCETCRKQLDQFKKATYSLTPESPIVVFEKHREDNCFVCNPTTAKLKTLSLKKSLNSVQMEVPERQEEVTWLSDQMIEAKCQQYNLSNMTKIMNMKTNNYCIAKFFMDNGKPIMQISVTIDENCVTRVFVYHKEISGQVNFPRLIKPENIDELFSKLRDAVLCIGNNDFPEIIRRTTISCEQFRNQQGDVVAELETSSFETFSDLCTVRHKNCEYFLKKSNITDRCDPCSLYRKALNTLSWREKNTNTVSSEQHKNMRNSYMSKEQLISKSENLSREMRQLRRSVSKYEELVAKIVDEEGQTVPEELHNICQNSLNSDKSPFADDSPQFFLWEQQKKQASLKNSKSMKWHPVMLRWCLSMYLKSPGAYEFLRQSGFLCLPHKTTILGYANFSDPKSGINIDVLRKLITLTNKDKGFARIVGIVFDEMKVKSGLIYSRHNGQIIGFSDMGDLNNELSEFKQRIEAKMDTQPPIATHMLTLMVRGLCSSLKFPIAYYPGQGFTSDQLFSCLWEGVRILESLDLKVLFMTSDGASPNRRFYRMHLLDNSFNLSEDGVVFWCWNHYTPFHDRRKIYFICDVPHLIKTTRNNFENSHAHKNTRNLMVNGYQISWQHIVSLLEWDMGPNKSLPGFRQTKLSTEHVFLSPPLRMKVSLAAQVLSNSVHLGLVNQGSHDTIETRKFVLMFDKFFDCLNVKSVVTGKTKRKDNLLPYVSKDDARLQWLVDEFLGYVNMWHTQSQAVLELPAEDRNKLCLSQQTREGLRITVRSFVEIVRYALDAGASYVLSDKLNQDVLEEHFGKQRMKGGARENPSVQDYQYTELKLQAGAASSLDVQRGNTSGRKDQRVVDITDDIPLIKRSKHI